jgi:hypothetical protein
VPCFAAIISVVEALQLPFEMTTLRHERTSCSQSFKHCLHASTPSDILDKLQFAYERVKIFATVYLT